PRLWGGWGRVSRGGAGAAFRWTVMAFSPPLWALWPLQALHALSFAAAFIGAIKLVESLARPDQASAAQSLSSALSAGVLIGLATLASGPLFAAFGSGGYLAMAGMALAGTVGTAWIHRHQRQAKTE
ncbi:MAG: MFS transporter, partial [Asticcacaulis sp.]